MIENLVRLGVSISGLLFLCIILITHSHAQSKNQHVGQWVHITVEEPLRSRQTCRYIDVLTRTYNLQGAMNGGVEGGYFLQRNRQWFLEAKNGCSEDDELNESKDFYRNDLWNISGERVNSDLVRVVGRYAKCVGNCEQPMDTADKFKTDLLIRNGTLEDIEQVGRLSVYRPALVVDLETQSAAAAFMDLVNPLLEGNCNVFYNSSLDPVTQTTVGQEFFCKIARQFSQLLPPVLYDQQGFALSAAIGSLKAGKTGDMLLFGNGDVLVQRALVVAANDGVVWIHAILRKQSDNVWKIWRFMP